MLYKDIDGKRCEPVERMVADVPESASGGPREMGARKRAHFYQQRREPYEARIPDPVAGAVRLQERLPYGYARQRVAELGFDRYFPVSGEIVRRQSGSLIAFETGEAVTYSLYNAQERASCLSGGHAGIRGHGSGREFAGRGYYRERVQKKQLTNMRASGSRTLRLIPPRIMSLEQCLEFLADDEALARSRPKTCV